MWSFHGSTTARDPFCQGAVKFFYGEASARRSYTKWKLSLFDGGKVIVNKKSLIVSLPLIAPAMMTDVKLEYSVA